MLMLRNATLAFVFGLLAGQAPRAQNLVPVVAFQEEGFPTVDSAPVAREGLRELIPDARWSSADELAAVLSEPSAKLLVLPYGSAFPEAAWSSIHAFLQRGGNLLVLGGRPFTRAAFHDASGWHLRDYSVRFTRQLAIDQYQETSSSEGLAFESNPDVMFAPAKFPWKRAFSPILRLSSVDLYNRGGSAGALDARLDALAWGVKDGRRMAAPLMQIDHFSNGFDGGRWIFLTADVDSSLYASAAAAELIPSLVKRAARGSESFSAKPVVPLYLPGEPVEIEIMWNPTAPAHHDWSARIVEYPEAQPSRRFEITAPLPQRENALLPAPKEKGLHIVKAELLEGNEVRAVYRSGFWIRDEKYLRNGPRLTVNHDYFELNGRPLAVIGTTYMSSEVQRLYFDHPNAFIWDRDLAQIQAAGLNMIRTGWWTGWDKFCDETGRPYERSLRTLEAYLMTARKYGLPVQFNFFAFLPDVLGGANAYLDPQAVRKQQTLVSAVVARFHDVPFVVWDLINEPSFSRRLWTMRPNEDGLELAAWNRWLAQRYPDRAALAAAWNVLPETLVGTISLPQEAEFNSRGMYIGRNSLRVYDYDLFAQESFAAWVAAMREKIRATGSDQAITVGQDEGGFMDRLSPAFFSASVDFTTSHSWWQNDALLWDSLVAKQPGVAMLIQETGVQRELNLDETARMTVEQEGALFERKVALSFVRGSGAIEWLWNTNSYMTEANEAPIGALRADLTEKPEATVMRNFAQFAKTIAGHLKDPAAPSVVVLTSQAAQFSAMSDLQLEAQRKAVRVLGYDLHLAPGVLPENQIAKLGSPKLVVLPSAQSLAESTWQSLLHYVRGGGNLLITGPMGRNEHWHSQDRAQSVGLAAKSGPLLFRGASLRIREREILLSFDQQKQFALEALHFADGASWKETAIGAGRIFWSAYPLELAEGYAPVTQAYRYVAEQLKISPAFEELAPLPATILVYPMLQEDSVLYVLESESTEDAKVDLRDAATGARLTLTLPAGRAALAVLSKSEKAVVARYGF